MPLKIFDAELVTNAIYVALAAFGGVARYLYSFIETGAFSVRLFLAHMLVSAFSGYMFAGFAVFLGVKETALFLFAGIGGFMGTKSLELIEERMKFKDINSKESAEKKPNKKH